MWSLRTCAESVAGTDKHEVLKQIAFADTQVGDITAPQTITYTNTGMMAATISDVSLGGANRVNQRGLERETGFEPATCSLEGCRSAN